MEKKCNKCGEIKMLAEFPKHKAYKDGIYSICKVCKRYAEKIWELNNIEKKRAARTKYRENNREKIREMDRDYYINNHDRYLEKAKIAQKKYYNTEKGKLKYKEQNEKMQIKFPEKIKARDMVNKALKSGELKKPFNCSLCNSEQFIIEAHHADYTKPLEITWLCRSCHAFIHRKIKSHRDRLSEKTPFGDAIVKTCEETARKQFEEVASPLKDGQ